MSYTIRDRDKGQVVAWDWEKSGVAEADCFLCHVPKASRGARKKTQTVGVVNGQASENQKKNGACLEPVPDPFT